MSEEVKNRIVWTHKEGEPYKNRVALYLRGRGNIAISFHLDGDRVWRSLGHRYRAKAIRQARGTAARLLERQDDGRELAQRRMNVYRDLVRVARMVDAPEGFAPPRNAYAEHGRWSEAKVRGTKDGYDDNRNPVASWSEAVRALGLKPYGDHYHADRGRILRDLQRVALKLGSPLRLPTRDEYREHGNWSSRIVTKHLEASCWTDLEMVTHLKIREPGRHRGVEWEQAA